ncbi:MAG TPA: hypothetical protein VJI12_04935 [archaeon]|nr:hypothetical protein [archaeon]
MTGIIITYEIDPSPAGVVVTRIADVRPISFCENGSYVFPAGLGPVHFLYQLGLVPKGDRALVYLQPPGVCTPDFGYGPITGRVEVRKEQEDLPGNYEKFPLMERHRKIFIREIIPDGVPFIDKETYDAVVLGSCKGFEKVFKELGFEARLRKAL